MPHSLLNRSTFNNGRNASDSAKAKDSVCLTGLMCLQFVHFRPRPSPIRARDWRGSRDNTTRFCKLSVCSLRGGFWDAPVVAKFHTLTVDLNNTWEGRKQCRRHILRALTEGEPQDQRWITPLCRVADCANSRQRLTYPPWKRKLSAKR